MLIPYNKTQGQQPQFDENGEVIATIEGHGEHGMHHEVLQPEDAEAIDNENASVIHDDQQPLTGFGDAAHSASMTSFGTSGQSYNTDSIDR